MQYNQSLDLLTLGDFHFEQSVLDSQLIPALVGLFTTSSVLYAIVLLAGIALGLTHTWIQWEMDVSLWDICQDPSLLVTNGSGAACTSGDDSPHRTIQVHQPIRGTTLIFCKKKCLVLHNCVHTIATCRAHSACKASKQQCNICKDFNLLAKTKYDNVVFKLNVILAVYLFCIDPPLP